jgi:hypothetical protein
VETSKTYLSELDLIGLVLARLHHKYPIPLDEIKSQAFQDYPKDPQMKGARENQRNFWRNYS